MAELRVEDAALPLEPHEKLTVLAKIAENAGRMEDMKGYMKERAETGVALNADERDLLSAAYKAIVAELRSSMDIMLEEIGEQAQAGNRKRAHSAQAYGAKLGGFLKQLCGELHEVLDPLIAKAEFGEPTVFYLKLKADYYRYMAENPMSKGKKEGLIQDCKGAYIAALKEADKHLLTTHPVRLGLSLNYAVFQHEVLRDTAAAIYTADTARRGAVESLTGMPEEAWRDAASAIVRLEDNVAMWREELDMAQQREGEAAMLEECDTSFSPKTADRKPLFHAGS